MNTVYKCEWCGKEFSSYKSCLEHEPVCPDKVVWTILTANLATGKVAKATRTGSKRSEPNAELAPVVISGGPLIAHVECADKDQLDQALCMLWDEIDSLRTNLLRYVDNSDKLLSDVDMRRKLEESQDET